MMEIANKPERPIEGKAEDFLDRGSFVDRLGKALVGSNGQSTGVVIALTGSWGSGKSSILNLLGQNLKLQYPNKILVVTFDPWLVSGRDDLITQFLAQVIGTINSEPKLKDRLKDISKRLATYGSHLSPLANFAAPGLGAVLKGGFTIAENALSKGRNLLHLRKELESELESSAYPSW